MTVFGLVLSSSGIMGLIIDDYYSYLSLRLIFYKKVSPFLSFCLNGRLLVD